MIQGLTLIAPMGHYSMNILLNFSFSISTGKKKSQIGLERHKHIMTEF